MVHRRIAALFLLAACGSGDDVAALRTELHQQQVQIAELEELVAMQGERLEAQSAILARLDDARIDEKRAEAAAEAAAPPPDWVMLEGDKVVLRRDAMPPPDELARMLRAIPHRDEAGETDGFRLAGIRRGSAVDHMGISNGDVVHRVAGVEVTSVERVMEAWQKTGTMQHVEVELTTRGTRRAVAFEIR